MSPNANLDIPDDPGSDTTRWTDEEIDSMKNALVEVCTFTFHVCLQRWYLSSVEMN